MDRQTTHINCEYLLQILIQQLCTSGIHYTCLNKIAGSSRVSRQLVINAVQNHVTAGSVAYVTTGSGAEAEVCPYLVLGLDTSKGSSSLASTAITAAKVSQLQTEEGATPETVALHQIRKVVTVYPLLFSHHPCVSASARSYNKENNNLPDHPEAGNVLLSPDPNWSSYLTLSGWWSRAKSSDKAGDESRSQQRWEIVEDGQVYSINCPPYVLLLQSRDGRCHVLTEGVVSQKLVNRKSCSDLEALQARLSALQPGQIFTSERRTVEGVRQQWEASLLTTTTPAPTSATDNSEATRYLVLCVPTGLSFFCTAQCELDSLQRVDKQAMCCSKLHRYPLHKEGILVQAEDSGHSFLMPPMAFSDSHEYCADDSFGCDDSGSSSSSRSSVVQQKLLSTYVSKKADPCHSLFSITAIVMFMGSVFACLRMLDTDYELYHTTEHGDCTSDRAVYGEQGKLDFVVPLSVLKREFYTSVDKQKLQTRVDNLRSACMTKLRHVAPGDLVKMSCFSDMVLVTQKLCRPDGACFFSCRSVDDTQTAAMICLHGSNVVKVHHITDVDRLRLPHLGTDVCLGDIICLAIEAETEAFPEQLTAGNCDVSQVGTYCIAAGNTVNLYQVTRLTSNTVRQRTVTTLTLCLNTHTGCTLERLMKSGFELIRGVIHSTPETIASLSAYSQAINCAKRGSRKRKRSAK